MKKISTKFAMASLGICLMLTLLLTGISFYMSNQFLVSEGQEKLFYMSKGYAKQFDARLGRVESTVDVLYNAIYTNFDTAAYKADPKGYGQQFSDTIEPIIKSNAENLKGIQGIYLTMHPDFLGHWNDLWYADVAGDGKYARVDSTLEDPSKFTADNPDFNYFFEPIQKNGPVWVDPYEDADLKISMVSYVRPVIKDGIVIGIVGADLKIDDIIKAIKDLKVFDSGMGMLVNQNKDVIIHPTIKEQTPLETIDDKAYAGLGNRLATDKDELLSITYKGKENYITYSNLTNGWQYLIKVPVSEVQAISQKLFMILISVGLFATVIAAVTGLLLARKLSKSINSMSLAIGKIGGLQLYEDRQIEELTEKPNEIGEMAKQIVSMQSILKSTVEGIQSQSKNLLNQSVRLSEDASDTAESMISIGLTIQDLSQGSADQAKEASQSTLQLDALDQNINESVKQAEAVKYYMEGAKASSEKSKSSMNDLKQSFNVSNSTNAQVQKSIHRLSESSKSIGEIVSVIQAIADQTNLLALNAAIEAARAGESGRGFAVVADEVRKLAEQTTVSTRQIESITHEILNEINETNQRMDEVGSINAKSNEVAGAVEVTFEELLSAMNHIFEELSLLTDNIFSVGQHKVRVVESIQNIAAVTEETSASAEAVANTVEREVSTIKDIAKLAESLKEYAAELERMASIFKLRE